MYSRPITFQDPAFAAAGGCLEITVCKGEDLSHLRWFVNHVRFFRGRVIFNCNKLEVFNRTSKEWLDLGTPGQIIVFSPHRAEYYIGPFVVDGGVVVWIEKKTDSLIFNKLFLCNRVPLPNEPAILEEILAVEMVYSDI